MHLEPEIKAFIAQNESLYTTSVAASIEEQRAVYAHLCTHFTPLHPARLNNRYDSIDTSDHKVPVRWYWKNNTGINGDGACIVYFHGGGFVVGGLESHDFICARLVNDTACQVVSVDYRLAPEHIFPAAFEDCFNVLRVLQTVPEKYGIDKNNIILCGDSAGGNLTAAVALANRDCSGTPLLGQIMIYPALGHELNLPSYIECADAPMLSTQDVSYYQQVYLGEGGKPTPYFAPLLARNFANLPPALLLPVEYDPLRDDSYVYHKQLLTAGVSSSLHLGKGLVHGCFRALETSPGVMLMYQKVLAFIKQLTRV